MENILAQHSKLYMCMGRTQQGTQVAVHVQHKQHWLLALRASILGCPSVLTPLHPYTGHQPDRPSLAAAQHPRPSPQASLASPTFPLTLLPLPAAIMRGVRPS